MDNKLTEKIQGYLEQAPENRNVIDGATMLLSLNRNRLFFQNVLRKPERFADKVEYELKKYLRIRLDRQTVSDVVALNETILPHVRETLSKGAPVISSDDDVPQSGTIAVGKRPDHDALPDEIKDLWDRCSNLWFKIKELFEQLKSMEKAAACDRYEYLKQLDEADKMYRANMQAYDGYTSDGSGMQKEEKAEESPDDPATISKKVNAARKYLSDNKKKLTDLKSTDESKYAALLIKTQERYDYLISTGNTVDAEQTAELSALGLIMK